MPRCAQRKRLIFSHRDRIEQRSVLKDHRHLAAHLLQLLRARSTPAMSWPPRNRHLAAVRLQETHDDLERHRFPHSASSQDAQRLARLNREAHILQHYKITKRLANVFESDVRNASMAHTANAPRPSKLRLSGRKNVASSATATFFWHDVGFRRLRHELVHHRRNIRLTRRSISNPRLPRRRATSQSASCTCSAASGHGVTLLGIFSIRHLPPRRNLSKSVWRPNQKIRHPVVVLRSHRRSRRPDGLHLTATRLLTFLSPAYREALRNLLAVNGWSFSYFTAALRIATSALYFAMPKALFCHAASFVLCPAFATVLDKSSSACPPFNKRVHATAEPSLQFALVPLASITNDLATHAHL